MEYPFLKIDLHVHTNHSDGLIKVPALLKKARKLGIGFAITDHNTIKGVIEAYRLKRKKDIIVPGIEVHSEEGPHFLIYFERLSELKRFHKKYVVPNQNTDPFSRTKLSMDDLVMAARKEKGVISIAHPQGRAWVNVEKAIKKRKLDNSIFRKVHAVETTSGQQPKRINKKAGLLRDKYNLARTGGSDAHSMMEFGRIVTVADAKGVAGFLERIRKNESFAVGRETRLYRKAISQLNIVKTHARYAGPYINHKIREKINKFREKRKE